MHWLSEKLDCGQVIAQKTFLDDGTITAGEVRQKQRQICMDLFDETIDKLVDKTFVQGEDTPCTFHQKSDIIEATTFLSTEHVSWQHLMRLGRATNHGRNGLFVRDEEGRVFRLCVSVERADCE